MIAVAVGVAILAFLGYLILGGGGGTTPAPAPLTDPNLTFRTPAVLTSSWNRGSGEQFPGYIGCYVDYYNDPVRPRILPHRRLQDEDVTADTCNAACAAGNFRYFGLQYASECYCGNGENKDSWEQADGNQCNKPCTANEQQTCGGDQRNSVYLVDTEAEVPCGECGCLDENKTAVLCVKTLVVNSGGKKGVQKLYLLVGDENGENKMAHGSAEAEVEGGGESVSLNIPVYKEDLARFSDGVVHMYLSESQNGSAELFAGKVTKTDTMFSTASCPGDHLTYCAATECCPGNLYTGGKTFPCPIANLSRTTCEASDSAEAQKFLLDSLMAYMSKHEKIRFLRGIGKFNTYGIYIGNAGTDQRFGIPTVNMQDSGAGFRNDQLGNGGTVAFARGPQQVTSYPCALALASTWSEDHMKRYGTEIGKEFRRKGANMILGPAVNVHRVPRNGRNAEYVSGESAYFGARMAKVYVKSVQAQRVLSSVKHFINNNQETCRRAMDAVTDARTRFELYYPPFEAAIEADVAAQMCGYNFVLGELNCQSKQIMKVELKQMLKFQGWVQSDWWALDSYSRAIDSGIDQEMPGGDFFTWERLSELSVDQVNDMMRSQLRLMLKFGLFEVIPGESCITDGGCNTLMYDQVTATSASRALSREISTNAVTMLKNSEKNSKKTLPLDGTVTKIALLGSTCNSLVSISEQLGLEDDRTGRAWPGWQRYSYYYIGGSGRIIARDPVSIYKGLQEKCPGGVDLSYQGCYWEEPDVRMFEHKAMEGMATPATCRTACQNYTYFGLQFYGECFCGNSLSKGVEAYVGECYQPCNADKHFMCGGPNKNSVYTVEDKGKSTGACEIVTDFSDNSTVAIQKASGADVAIICAGTSGTEDIDRVDLNVDQNDFMTAVASGITDIPVVALTMTPGTIVMPWINDVDAAMNLFLGGEFAGNAFADNLYGDHNPSGKSPIAYPHYENSTIPPCTPPGNLTCKEARPYPCEYTEGLFFGWYNMTDAEILFPFGWGLSYTTFEYSDLEVHTGQNAGTKCPEVDTDRGDLMVCVTAKVTNTGNFAGTEVAQLYMGFPEAAKEPPRLLRGFNRVELDALASTDVAFPIMKRDVQIFSNDSLEWEDIAGTFPIYVGTNARDTPLTSSFTLPSLQAEVSALV